MNHGIPGNRPKEENKTAQIRRKRDGVDRLEQVQ